MPHAPRPSAMGEQPRAVPHPRTPLFRPLFARVVTPSVTRTLLRRLHLSWSAASLRPPRISPRFRSPVGRSTRPHPAALRCATGTRTCWAGRQCPRAPRNLPCDSAWACASTSWTYRWRRAGRPCAISPGPLLWRCGATGWNSWWPRAARRSCRVCWTGWSGARWHSIYGRSVRAACWRLRCRRRAG